MSWAGRKFVGFFFVAVAGLMIDISIAWSMHHFLGVSLMLSATVGFLVATVFNYRANLSFTFADRSIRPTMRGFLAYVTSVLIGLATRLTVLAMLQWLLPASLQFPLAMLIVAAAASLVINFIVANKWAFSE